MGGTQAAPKGDDPGQVGPAVALLRHVLELGGSLLGDIAQPLLIAADTPVGVALRIRPGLLVHGIDGKHHDLPGIDPGSQCVGHVEILKIEKAAILAGDVQHRAACVTVDLAFHVPPKRRAVVLEILHFHGSSSFVVLFYAFCRGQPRFYSPASYSRVWNTNGSCFSQLASLWVPPGTMRLVRWMPRVSSLPHSSVKSRRLPSRPPISREP